MQTRLFASLAGGLIGLAFAPEINTGLHLDLPLAFAFAGCALAGLAIGYVGSALADVFVGQSRADRARSEN
jgi:hypothetical protein